ncbi:hypothetical protein [Lysinibacillus capsici]|uniref:hypothetical protein n=1 Tax=Lysinibacillus capsici TaxID=2115968 RepID=UPI001F3D0E3D|nr:hypothetical protein [Lysinibacillus capsici]
MTLYYNPYPYFVHPYHYPTSPIANHFAIRPFAQHLAMPTNNPFPPVDTHKLKASASRIKAMMQQAQLLTDKIDSSQQFAHDLMNAAQLSNKTEVEKLITSTGITMKFETNYTPDSFRIRLIDNDCCGVTLNLNW